MTISDPYYQSPRWAEIRKARLVYDGYRCVDCGHDGSDMRLEVHHLTYDRFGGNERLEDLQTLCNGCHMLLHGRAPMASPVGGPSLDEFATEANQRDVARRAEVSKAYSSGSLADRIARLKAPITRHHSWYNRR